VVDTEGAWVELKKPILEEMLVIDPSKLSKGTQQKLSKVYDELSKKEILALPQMVEDEVREKLDNVVSDALGLDNDLSVVRKLLLPSQ
jgi:hypothetical protein